jgi:hypothetical protein
LNACKFPLAEAQVWPIMRGDFGSSRDNLVELGPSPSGLEVGNRTWKRLRFPGTVKGSLGCGLELRPRIVANTDISARNFRIGGNRAP